MLLLVLFLIFTAIWVNRIIVIEAEDTEGNKLCYYLPKVTYFVSTEPGFYHKLFTTELAYLYYLSSSEIFFFFLLRS